MLKIFLLAAIVLPLSQAYSKTSTKAYASDAVVKLCGSQISMDLCSKIKISPAGNLTADVLEKMNKLVDKSMDDWADSILEGDVYTDYKGLHIELTEVVTNQQGHILGYRVRFSVNGWATGKCTSENRDSDQPESLNGCEAGRIVQTVFINSELTDFEVPDLGATIENPDLILD